MHSICQKFFQRSLYKFSSPFSSKIVDSLPRQRMFYPISADEIDLSTIATASGKLRVLQFNMLAYGMSGLRADLGGFAGVSRRGGELTWSRRKEQILHELTQYEPDVLTLQEVDRFHDWLEPEMAKRGYVGIFAARPASPCLQVSPHVPSSFAQDVLESGPHILFLSLCETVNLLRL